MGGDLGRPPHGRRPVQVRQDLLCLGQERRPRGRQRDVMGAALQQPDTQLTLQPLHLLAQRGLHDVLPRRGAAEVQLLGQDNEITKLAQLHTCHHLPLCGSDGLRGGGNRPGARPPSAEAPCHPA
jgi:hypothetical protein